VVRTKDLIKVKGMLINPSVLSATLDGLHEVLDFQVIVRRQDEADPFSSDELLIRIATEHSSAASVTGRVSEAVMRAVQIRPRVEIVDRDDIYDPTRQAKAARIVDLRRPVSDGRHNGGAA
jgi:phenylacetate-coenzyme A ligase PaaK-like adenylate-forming protein